METGGPSLSRLARLLRVSAARPGTAAAPAALINVRDQNLLQGLDPKRREETRLKL
jgi:hypothetical protein